MSLRVNQVGYTVNGKTILHNVSLSLASGIFTAVVGPNGAGKSTLLKVMSGELQPSQGHITLQDRALSSFSASSLAKVRAVLSQKLHVAFSFTVEEVVGLGLHVHRLLREEINTIVEEVMLETGTTALRHRQYPTLSGGEQQRVQLARALAQIWEGTLYDRFLLLDEPTNNLDLTHQHALLATAQNAMFKNMGVLAIVHDLNLAIQYADHIIFMKNGTICAEGAPLHIITQELIEEVFAHPVTLLNSHDGLPVVVPVPRKNNPSTSLKLKTNGKLSYSE